MRYSAPQMLQSHHRVEGFVSRSAEQTSWLKDHASQSHRMGGTAVQVVTVSGTDEVVGYYAWRMAELRAEESPARFRKGAGRYPQPVALIARLAVDVRHERVGLGSGMLRDALIRSIDLAARIGCRGVLIHCESEEARRFYLANIPEFAESPSDPLHLVLLMKDIRRTLGIPS